MEQRSGDASFLSVNSVLSPIIDCTIAKSASGGSPPTSGQGFPSRRSPCQTCRNTSPNRFVRLRSGALVMLHQFNQFLSLHKTVWLIGPVSGEVWEDVEST